MPTVYGLRSIEPRLRLYHLWQDCPYLNKGSAIEGRLEAVSAASVPYYKLCKRCLSSAWAKHADAIVDAVYTSNKGTERV